ncbi:hypothetical protein [Streptacidiphilus sp. P02-A3a]|uniref:hypothetical protein n=1 Tax=Streptacidiphilus sp. P02-A3a TaxID=2704468 RepID=UPI0015FE163C|nr:hypothetical protein [Streptacidiphilus sp. P02-A3a]QMU68150.1 hypothetical protein GXP74_07855 [Streptacidiphilus sp. P02-A3a]
MAVGGSASFPGRRRAGQLRRKAWLLPLGELLTAGVVRGGAAVREENEATV